MNTTSNERASPVSDPTLSRLSSLMDEALALSEGDRQAICTTLAKTEPALASKLEALLRAHQSAEQLGFLEGTISPDSLLGSAGPANSREPQKEPGLMLGPYRLLKKIGDGGMSSVWLAERDYGTFVHQVAIKCLPAYFGNAELRERLLQEAAILSRVSHPGIAQFLDAGLHNDSEPYIALELIDGEPITAYCDRLKLDVKARVRLVAEACEAIAFLHSRAIVHRDIKPSNVFVDQGGKIKLLDFGIAKIVDEVPAATTRASIAAFTPEYAAPEQISGGAITTATDVYSVGVLLYRLLTGNRPYGRALAPMMFASEVLNTQPSRPSTLFWPAGGMSLDEAERIARERNATVKQLRNGLRDDLDNIVLKCLEKESERRYTTVEALRADLLAHLASRPVHARPPSMFYRARKFAARHRGGVAASLVTACALLGALGYGAWQTRQTQLEAENTKRVLTFLQTLIAEASPNNTGVETIGVLDLLQRAPDVAKKQFPENASMQYQVLKPVDAILRDLGALPPLETLGAEMVKISDSIPSLAVEEIADVRRSYAGTLARMGKAKDADVVLAAAMRRLEDADKEQTLVYAQTMMTKAEAHILRREVPEAIRLAKESYARAQTLLSLGAPERTALANAAASILMADFRFVEAGNIASVDLTNANIVREPKASARLQYRIVSAGITAGLGDARAAATQYPQLIDEAERLYGGRHDTYLTLLWLSARAHSENGDYVAATKMLEKTLSIIRKEEGANTISMSPVNVLPELAVAQLHRGEREQARLSLQEAEAHLQRLGRKGGTLYRSAAYLLAMADGNLELAESHLKNWLAIFPPSMPATDMNKVRVELERANLLRVKGEATLAAEIYGAAIASSKAQLAPNHYQIARAQLLHAMTLADAQQLSSALPLAHSAVKQLNQTLGMEHPLSLQGEFILGEIERKNGVASGATRAQTAAKNYELRMKRPLDTSLSVLH
jgi:eukaryotic-like serine/threonine-protein kinase